MKSYSTSSRTSPPCFIHDQALRLLHSSDQDRRRACLDPQLLRPLRRTQQFSIDTTGLDPQQEYLKERTFREDDLELSWYEIPNRDLILDREIRWDRIDRSEQAKHTIPDTISLNRLCIVSDAGMGKSKLIEWFLYRLNTDQVFQAGDLAFEIDLSVLEKVWKRNDEEPARVSFFDVLIRFVADRSLAKLTQAKGKGLELQRAAFELLLAKRAKEGKLTLLADGLDQISDKSHLLAEFLDLNDPDMERIRLIVAGRSNAILMQWTQAFSDPAWTFVRVEPFTVDQQTRYLGWIENAESGDTPAKRELRYTKIPQTARDLLCIPRVLQYLREFDNYQDIRTAADVYSYALDAMIARGLADPPIGKKGKGKLPEEFTDVKASEVRELLSRQAFESFIIQLDHSALTFANGKPSKVDAPVPRYLYDIPKFESEEHFEQFKREIYQRLDGELKSKYERVWNAVQHLNQFLNYGIFDRDSIGRTNPQMVWANRSLHEFLLAFYFANYASREESQYLWDWIYLPNKNESDQYYPFWQFLCEMPSKARTPSVWLESISMLYQPNFKLQPAVTKDYLDNEYPFYSKRSNEMIYRSWETLDDYTRKGFPSEIKLANHIRDRWWGEFEGSFLEGEYGAEFKAIAEEIKDHLLLIPDGTVKLGTTPQRQRWDEYFQWGIQKREEFRNPSYVEEYFDRPYFRTRAGRLEKERLLQILKANLREADHQKAIPEFLEAFYGLTYHSNPELTMGAFELGRQTISNAWFGLYHPRHTRIYSDYRDFSKTPKHPAVAISFFDAWVYCQWLRWEKQSCRLPWETEWEYAAKYRFESWEQEYWWEGAPHHAAPEVFLLERINCNETTDKSKYTDGCTVVPDPSRASPRTKELDTVQGKGLMDMQGNTWEWCQDRYRRNYEDERLREPFASQEEAHRRKSLEYDPTFFRVLRGGSFNNFGRNASASFRGRIVPTGTSVVIGFRVARAPKGKP
jgi:formylglycine-generating enzyme required for sulfatase activity